MSERGGNSMNLVERYARLWATTSPDLHALDTFLAAAPNCPASELAEILRTDLTARWQAGQAVPAEDYIRRLGLPPDDQEAVVDLIYAEFLVREELHQVLDPEEFYRRFPGQANVLRDQFALHGAISGGTYVGSDSPTLNRVPLLPDSEEFPRSFGRYKLLRTLGKGGMGKVYLARDELLDRQVAVKVPRLGADGSPAMIARFLREAQAAAALNHPHLCPIYEVGQVNGLDYLTMPFITGGTLADRVPDKQPVPPEEAVPMVIKIATALAAAHQAGVIHRDLKPANILINEAGDPVITDFGLAVRMENHGPLLTVEGGMLGTVAYMPPEQIGYNSAAVGPRSDVYSLGVILFELLTGRTPFIGAEHEILRKTLAETPVAPSRVRPGLSPSFDGICLKALAKSPADRFASMAEFSEHLGAALVESRHPRRRIPRAAILIGVIVLLCGLGSLAIPEVFDWKSIPLAAKHDPFPAGAVWSGTYRFLPPHESEGPAILTIKERSGEKFVGEYATIQHYRWKVLGTVAENVIRWELTDPLTEQSAGAVPPGRAFITGKFTDRELTGTYRDQGDDSRAVLKLTPKQ